VVELQKISSVIVTSLFNNNPHFITGQRGRKREIGSPPITIKTATEEFLGLQLNAARIARCVLRHFVHYAKQCSNEPAQRNEETAAQFVLVCCMYAVCSGISYTIRSNA
jgi:hypothetical protein